LPWRWHPRPSCMPHGARRLHGKADRGSRRRGEREPRSGRSGCCRCSRSGSWSRDRRQPQDHPVGRNPASGHAPERRGGTGRAIQTARGCGCPERPHPCSGITLSDERDQRERARTRRSVGKPRSADMPSEPHPNGRSVAQACNIYPRDRAVRKLWQEVTTDRYHFLGSRTTRRQGLCHAQA
jgi:hypothetical protein